MNTRRPFLECLKISGVFIVFAGRVTASQAGGRPLYNREPAHTQCFSQLFFKLDKGISCLNPSDKFDLDGVMWGWGV